MLAMALSNVKIQTSVKPLLKRQSESGHCVHAKKQKEFTLFLLHRLPIVDPKN